MSYISSRKDKYGCLLGRVTRDGGKGRYAGSFSEKKIFQYVLYTNTFWANFIYCMPKFKNKNFLAVLCNHSEIDVYYSWQVDC